MAVLVALAAGAVGRNSSGGSSSTVEEIVIVASSILPSSSSPSSSSSSSFNRKLPILHLHAPCLLSSKYFVADLSKGDLTFKLVL